MSLFACLVLAACSGGQATVTGPSDDADPTISWIEVSPSAQEVPVGDTAQLQATVYGSDGSVLDRTVSWDAEDPNVASVDSDGTVVGQAEGSTTVRARVSTSSGASDVSVPGSRRVKEVEARPDSLSLEVGDTASVTATLYNAQGDTLVKAVDWSSLDAGVASVDGSGTVTGQGAGSTGIVATADGAADTTSVEVSSTSQDTTVASVTVSPDSVSVGVDSTTQLSATVENSSGEALNRSVSWSSLDTVVASVDGTGTVSGQSGGTTGIVATVDGVTDTATVAVSSVSAPEMPASATVTEVTRSTDLVDYEASWDEATGADSYEWQAGSDAEGWTESGAGVTSLSVEFSAPRSSSDDDSYFCVQGTNEAGPGEPKCVSFVVPAASSTEDTVVASVTVSPSSTQVDVGGTASLSATVENSSGETLNRSPSWSSLNSSVATVDGSGIVTGQSTGTTGIVASVDGVADTAAVDVVESDSIGGDYPIYHSPIPSSGQTILLDTRSGGGQSIQDANITTLSEANTAAGTGTYGAEPFAFTTDFDGQGTSAWVARYRAVNGNYGDRRAFIQTTTPSRREIYVQWKQWMGRRAGDGVGWGVLESFDFTNPNDPVGNAARKNVRIVGPDWSGGNALWTGAMPGPDPVPMKFYDEQNFTVMYDGSWTPEQLENSYVVFTYRIKCESSQGAGDGVMEMWLEKEGVLIAQKSAYNIDMGCQAVRQFNVGLMMRSPIEDMSEYFWDLVIWEGN